MQKDLKASIWDETRLPYFDGNAQITVSEVKC